VGYNSDQDVEASVDSASNAIMKTVQITLDSELAEAVDRAVEKLGTSRSGFTRDALRRNLARLERQELERRHREGYARHPVAPGEFDVWEEEQAWGD